MDIKHRQIQALSPSHKLVEAMKILQMNYTELSAYILSIAEENPLLDLDEFDSHVSFEKLTWLSGFQEKTSGQYHRDDETVQNRENLMPDGNENRLDWFLLSQIFGMGLDEEEERVCKYLTQCVDENGHMDITPEELSNTLKIDRELAEKCIFVMRGLEPCGICAKDAIASLIYQARQHENELAVEMISEYMEDIARGRFSKISKALSVPLAEVKQTSEFINSLDPIPGQRFDHRTQTRYLSADLVLGIVDGRLEIDLMRPYSPNLKINEYYFELLNTTDDGELKEYLGRKLYSVQQLIQNVSKREDTLLRCAREIAEIQKEFFLSGGSLYPMTEEMIAERLEIDKSTVSRAINGKYIQCGRGIIPMRDLFSTQMQNEQGGAFSADQVKTALLSMVQREDKQKPYSDQQLCRLLNDSGFQVSRRVIAKYREQLGIPSSYLRTETTDEKGT